MVEPRMTEAQITLSDALTETRRLNAYIDDLELNLPSAVFSVDAGVKAARARIKELEGVLEVYTKIEEERKIDESKAIEASKLVYADMLSDIQDFVVSLEERSNELHHSQKHSVSEVLKNFQFLLRDKG